MKNRSWLAVSVTVPIMGALLGCSSEVATAGNTITEEAPPDETGNVEPAEPVKPVSLVATDLAITEIALFQGVKLSLMKDGAAAKNAYASPVAGRPGLLRVYVKPGKGYHERALTAELTLHSSGGTDAVRLTKMNVNQASTEGAINTTMNFTIAAEDIAQGASFKVRILNPPDMIPADGTRAQYPQDDSAASFNALSSGKLRVKLVPVRYDTDGSARLPDTSAAQVERYRTAFLEQYPVTDVEVTVRDAIAWTSGITANGSGFDNILEEMVSVRAQDRPSSDVYYMGIFAPATSFQKYCGSSCITGLSGLISNPSDSQGRASVGIGFTGSDAAGTCVHEVGHAHGRELSPCNVSGSRSFPYTDGSVGSWGYGILSKQLYSPSSYSDFMGYCHPTWVSDYTYGALLTRVRAVSPLTKSIELPGGEYRFVHINAEGHLRWGRTLTLPAAPTNTPTTVRAVEANGTNRNVTGYYYPYAESDGGYMLVRNAEVSGKRLEIDLRGTTRTLAAALR